MNNNVINTILSTFILLQSSSHLIDISQLKGFWIEKEYLSILESSLSPKKAIKDYKGPIPYVEIRNDGIQWLYNFHDGDGYSFEDIKHPKPNIVSFSGGRKGISRFIVDTSDANLLTWENNDIKKQIFFVKVNNSTIYHFINSVVISGQYQDKKGRLYTFIDSGVCDWNNKKIKYQLALDCDYCELDWFINNSEKDNSGQFIVYGFRRTKNELLFYRSNPTDSELRTFKKDPFLRLKKIK